MDVCLERSKQRSRTRELFPIPYTFSLLDCLGLSLSQRTEVKEIVSLAKLGIVSGCLILSFVGVLGQLAQLDTPRYFEKSTDLLNPWATWCPSNCYGTGWAHWGGPYSIFWYWANAGLTLNGFLPYTLVLFAGNVVGQILLYRSRLAIPFGISSLITILAYPQNMIVTWFLFLGFYDRWGLWLAPIFKFPVGDFSGRMVLFILSNPTSAGEPDNWPIYLWLSILWIVAFRSSKVSPEIPKQQGNPPELYPVSKNQPGESWVVEDQDETDR